MRLVSAPVTRAVLIALGALVGGCLAVTVNVTFPQQTLDNAAAGIEDLVRSPAQAPAPTNAPPAPKREGRALLERVGAWIGPARAEAQVPELKTRTPEIMAAIESRRARYPELGAAEGKGCIGENNRGFTEVRPGASCPPNTATLVEAENRDRTLLQTRLMEQNNMAPSELPKLQHAFAKAHRDRAPAGTWVQDDAGAWTRK